MSLNKDYFLRSACGETPCEVSCLTELQSHARFFNKPNPEEKLKVDTKNVNLEASCILKHCWFAADCFVRCQKFLHLYAPEMKSFQNGLHLVKAALTKLLENLEPLTSTV